MKRIVMVAGVIFATVCAGSCGHSDPSGMASSELESIPSHSEDVVLVHTSESETDILPQESRTESYFESDGKESAVLSYQGEFSPVFAYDRLRDVLLAYCVNDEAAMPYNLSENVPKDGTQRILYIPETQDEIEVFWETSSQLWHVVDVSDSGRSDSESSGLAEYVVYLDSTDLLDYSDALRRVHPPGASLRYYTVLEGVCYVPQNNELQFAQDLDGDGDKEYIRYLLSDPAQSEPVHSIQFNGQKIWQDTRREKLVYAYLIDVHKQDPYLLIALLFEDANDMLRTVLIHYDGNRVLAMSVLGEASIREEGRIDGLAGGVVVDSILSDFAASSEGTA